MWKLKFQYCGHLMWRADQLEKTLMLGKIEGRRRRGWQRMRCLNGVTDAMDLNLGKLREIASDREACHKESESQSQTWLSDWKTTTKRPDIHHCEWIKILLKKRIQLLGTVQGASGGAGEVLGDTGADDGKLDKTKNFVKSREIGGSNWKVH